MLDYFGQNSSEFISVSCLKSVSGCINTNIPNKIVQSGFTNSTASAEEK